MRSSNGARGIFEEGPRGSENDGDSTSTPRHHRLYCYFFSPYSVKVNESRTYRLL